MNESMRRTHSTHTSGPTGFTLIELAVVVAIIAVLLALAQFSLRRPLNSAADRVSRATVEQIVSAEASLYAELDSYIATPSSLVAAAPEVTVIGGYTAPTASYEASVAMSGVEGDRDAAVGVAALSESGTCWMVKLVPTGSAKGIAYGKDTSVGPGDCTGNAALTLTDPDVGTTLGNDWAHAEDLN